MANDRIDGGKGSDACNAGQHARADGCQPRRGKLIVLPGGRAEVSPGFDLAEFERAMRRGVWALVEANQFERAVIEALDLPNPGELLEASCAPTKFIRTGKTITTVTLSGECWGGVARYKEGDLTFRRDADRVTVVERRSAAFKVVDIFDHYGGNSATIIELDNDPVVPYYQRIWQYSFITFALAVVITPQACCACL